MKKTKWMIPAALVTSLVAGVALAHGGPHGAHMFERLDTNKDGKITKAEAEKVREQWFAEVDTNKDNALTRAEIQKWKETKFGNKGKNDKADKGKRRGNRDGHHGGRMFERLDTNKDGKISKSEAQAKSNWMFERLDTNKDGVITRAEAMNAKKNWKTKKGEKGPKSQHGPRGKGKAA